MLSGSVKPLNRKVVLGWLAALLVSSIAFAQKPVDPCFQQAVNAPGKVFRNAGKDKLNGDPPLVAQATRRLDEMLGLVKGTYPGQKGFDAEYTRIIMKHEGSSYRPFVLSVEMYTYYCRHDDLDPVTKKELPGVLTTPNFVKDGYSNQVNIVANYPNDFLQKYMKLSIDGTMKTVGVTYPIAGEWRGRKLYDNGLKGLWVVLERPGQSAFIPVTRQQYVAALLEHYKEYYGTPDHPGSYRGGFSMPDILKDMREMEAYLQNTPPSTLNLPAKNCGLGYWASPDGNFASKQVCDLFLVNHDYFRKDVPEYLPQVIFLNWLAVPGQGESTLLGKQFSDQFPVEKLQSMLDK